jgi:hypothetical protein
MLFHPQILQSDLQRMTQLMHLLMSAADGSADFDHHVHGVDVGLQEFPHRLVHPSPRVHLISIHDLKHVMNAMN